MKSINFIEMPDQLNDMDMDLLRGGQSGSSDGCSFCNCHGSSCNGNASDALR